MRAAEKAGGGLLFIKRQKSGIIHRAYTQGEQTSCPLNPRNPQQSQALTASPRKSSAPLKIFLDAKHGSEHNRDIEGDGVKPGRPPGGPSETGSTTQTPARARDAGSPPVKRHTTRLPKSDTTSQASRHPRFHPGAVEGAAPRKSSDARHTP